MLYQVSGGVRQEVSGHYVFEGDGQVGFAVGAYDTSRPLVIDPTLSYSTCLGGGSVDEAGDMAIDASGNAYVTGQTFSTNFPTANPLQPAINGGPNVSDVFVTKLNADGSALVYSTYLGGENEDIGSSIAVDASGNAYVTGLTLSSQFPTTPGAFQRIPLGTQDAFVAKLNAAGSALVYSSFLGGHSDDQTLGIAIDSTGNAYVTGYTSSSDFPTTAGALQLALGSAQDGFVTKLNADGSALVYSTYLGGGDMETSFARAIAVDGADAAYVIGRTASTSFPTTPAAVQPTFGGGESDAFVAKLNATGSALVYATYLGGSGVDDGIGIAVDSAGSAYVVGDTLSTNFPTKNPLQPLNGGSTDAFVAKLDPAGSSLVYSTYLGGSNDEDGFAIGVDAGGNAYVGGDTLSSADFPTKNPAQAVYGGGGDDGFVARLNSNGTALDYATFLGGNATEEVDALAVDRTGDVYVTGRTASTTFPTMPGVVQPASGGVINAFITKLEPGALGLVVNTTDDELTPGNGKTSLREAIELANSLGGQTITFDPAVFPPTGGATIQLTDDATHGTLELKANVTILGPGANAVVVMGAGATSDFSVFTVDAGVQVTLSGLTISGGNSHSGGGGVLNQGILTLTGSTVAGNSADVIGGGGVFNENSATMTLKNDTIVGNSAPGVEGGGVLNYAGGLVTMTDCTVANNTAFSGAGIASILAAGPDGMTVIDCTIANNTAMGAGGGVYSVDSVARFTLINTTISGNTASTIAGGGIFSNNLVTLEDCTVAANRAANSPTGGIELHDGTLTLQNTIVAGNFQGAAPGTTPGDLALTNASFDPGSAYNLIGNGGLGGLTNGVNNNQVGVADAGLGPLQANGGPTMTMALLSGSPALDAASNALVPAGVTTDQRGLARVVNGTADIGAFESQTIIPSFVVDTALDVVNPGDGKTSLREAIAFANASPGHTITFDPAVFPAAGTTTIPLAGDAAHGTLTLRSDVTILGPGAKALAITGGGLTSDFNVFTVEAGVQAALSGVTVTRGHFSGKGGGIFSSGILTLTDCDITSNTAGSDGGGLYVASGTTTLIGGNVAGNAASVAGGAIEVGGGAMTVTGTLITGNFAIAFGGGIGNLGTLSLRDVTVAGNTANSASGGVFNLGTLTMIDCTVAGNKAPQTGGVANNNAGVVTMTGCTVSGNTATVNGSGGIGNFDPGAMMTLTNCTIAGNTAASAGGGISNTATLVLINCTVAGNRVTGAGAGGGIDFEAGKVTLYNTIVAGNYQGAAPGRNPNDIYRPGVAAFDTLSAYNLIGPGGSGNVSGGFNHNRVGLDPLLGPLQDNGGRTQTMALLDGSPAFDAGSLALVPAGLITDQRGLPRVVDSFPDLGAFESQTLLATPSLVVNTTSDELTAASGKTSLREAIALANALGSGTITFDPAVFPAAGTATIQLIDDNAHQTLELASNVTIVGPGARSLTVREGGKTTTNSGVFLVDTGANATLSGLTITGGNASFGGGIENIGNTTLSNCAIAANQGSEGGGIFNFQTMTLVGCTIAGNTLGGGIFNLGLMTMTNCTVSGNSADAGGGIDNQGAMTMTNCTVAGNRTLKFPGGGFLSTNSGTVTLNNTIIAGNFRGASPSIVADDVSFPGANVNSASANNLIGTGSAGGLKDRLVDPAHQNRLGVLNPGLGPLQDNRGPTMTMALLVGSIARNAGSNTLLPAGVTTDQRGLPRTNGGITDIGAYESQDLPVLLKVNPLIPGTSAIVITGSPKNDIIVINVGTLKKGLLGIKRAQTKHGISVTINGVPQGLFFPTSRDIFIAAGDGVNRVKIKGAGARSVRLHAIDGALRVTTVGKGGAKPHTLLPGAGSQTLIFSAAVVGGPLRRPR